MGYLLMLLLLLLLFVGVVGVMGVMGCGDILWNEDCIMVDWMGFFWGGVFLGFFSDFKEEEFECFCDVGFLVVMFSGFKIFIFIFLFIGFVRKKNCLRKLLIVKKFLYMIFFFLINSNFFMVLCVVMGLFEV